MGENKACHRIKNSRKSENKAFKRKLGSLESNKKQNITNLSREEKKKRMTDDKVMPSKF